MEKVNIKFNNNGTVTYQHKKILEFMPHLSVITNDEIKLTVPNIPLLVSFALVHLDVICFKFYEKKKNRLLISDADYTSK